MNKKPFRAADGPMLMLLAFAMMMLGQVALSIIMVPFVFNGIGTDILNYLGLIAFQAIYLGTYLHYTKKRGIKSSFSPRNKITIWSILAALLIAIISFTCFIGPAYLFEGLIEGTGYTSQGIEASGALQIIILVFATVIAAPICEESVFRSALLSGLKKARKDDIGTSLLCGLCFALMHINPSQTVYQFCLGTVAAYITLKCKNVLPAMVLHGTSNLLALIMSMTTLGQAMDEFYMKVNDNILIALILCALLPIVACVLIWLICRYLHKAEKKKYPNKFEEPRVIWIDENTKEPIYEGDEAPVVTEENRMVQRGFSPFTGAPVYVDRLELQSALMEEYLNKHDEKKGALGKNSYKTALVIYFAATITLWLLTFVSGMFLTA